MRSRRPLRSKPLNIIQTRIKMILKQLRPSSRKLPMHTRLYLTQRKDKPTTNMEKKVSSAKLKVRMLAVASTQTTSSTSSSEAAAEASKVVAISSNSTSTSEAAWAVDSSSSSSSQLKTSLRTLMSSS